MSRQAWLHACTKHWIDEGMLREIELQRCLGRIAKVSHAWAGATAIARAYLEGYNRRNPVWVLLGRNLARELVVIVGRGAIPDTEDQDEVHIHVFMFGSHFACIHIPRF